MDVVQDPGVSHLLTVCGMALSHAFASAFAEDWIASWNAHDLHRILEHYTDDFEMSSPFIISRNEDASGTLKGKEAVGNYWRRALEGYPDLHFELIEVLVSVNTICIYYNSRPGIRAVEWLYFNAEGLVTKASGSYNKPV